MADTIGAAPDKGEVGAGVDKGRTRSSLFRRQRVSLQARTKAAIFVVSRRAEENPMEAPPLERKLVAILAADVASYSRMMEVDEEGTLATLSAFRLVTDGLISLHEGRICGTAGDSILAAFGSALAAVQCAVDIQNELSKSNNEIEKDRRMQFRIGINVGDVMLKDGEFSATG